MSWSVLCRIPKQVIIAALFIHCATLGGFSGNVAILSTINEVPALGVFKGKIMTEFARAKVSLMLTFKSVEQSKAYSFQL